jgi:tetratricopeptide (TPR) repeat protein
LARSWFKGTGSGCAFLVRTFVVCFLLILSTFPWAVSEGSVDYLVLGEAYYMSGNFADAARERSHAAGTGQPALTQRAFYLLGRISLLTGDFRQAKEYFERSTDIGGGYRTTRIMALAGIGDTLYASGHYEEAIRRYRIAQSEAGGNSEEAVLGLKTALCEYSLGRKTEAMEHLRGYFRKIPVLSGWVGREEDFVQSMIMAGLAPLSETAERIYLIAGPVPEDYRDGEVVDAYVPVKAFRKGDGPYLEYGPLTDMVEATILSERIKSRFSVPVEIVTK